MMRGIAAAGVFVAVGSAFGAVMPQLPKPVCADTEVCTNVPCTALLSDVRERGTAAIGSTATCTYTPDNLPLRTTYAFAVKQECQFFS